VFFLGLLVAIELQVVVDIDAEQERRRDPAHQEQLFDRIDRAVLGGIAGREAGVVIDLGALLARLVVGVEPIENRVGHIFGHAGQRHQQRAAGNRALAYRESAAR